MFIKNLISIIKAYRFLFIKIFLYEIFYILRGFKGNNINLKKDKRLTDNIPCPYYFLKKIELFLKKKNFKFLIDLGCGSGRSIYFLNKTLHMNYVGIEYFEENYLKCKKIFENNQNIEIINDDFMSFDFLKFNCDCYFINDPLRNLEEYNKLVLKIIEKNEQSNKIVYFILINIGKDKHKIFDKYRLL